MMMLSTPPVYHRGDPLDIPLIDHHLVIRLLFPRITNAIRWAFPKVYLDWTVDVTSFAAIEGSATYHDSESIPTSNNKFSIRLRRLVEILLHASVILGSCHLQKKNGSFVSNVWVGTPAMRNLGMFLIPKGCLDNKHNNSGEHPPGIGKLQRDSLRSKIRAYCKVIALVATTVIVPGLYEELKHGRQQHLKREEERRRISPECVMTTHLQQSVIPVSRACESEIIDQRAKIRKSYLQNLVFDTILGIAEVFIPPLRLINCVLYLWGVSSTPDLGMRLTGWDYSTVVDASPYSSQSINGWQHQRHANFHYGYRRLFVEEVLSTVTAVLPSRNNATATNVTGTTHLHTDVNSIPSAQNSSSTGILDGVGSGRLNHNYNRRGSWLRQRALSFVGVIDNTRNSPSNRYSLSCAKCGSDQAAIPYVASCGHVYCYICIRTAMTDDLNFRCLCCGKCIESSNRIEFK